MSNCGIKNFIGILNAATQITCENNLLLQIFVKLLYIWMQCMMSQKLKIVPVALTFSYLYQLSASGQQYSLPPSLCGYNEIFCSFYTGRTNCDTVFSNSSILLTTINLCTDIHTIFFLNYFPEVKRKQEAFCSEHIYRILLKMMYLLKNMYYM